MKPRFTHHIAVTSRWVIATQSDVFGAMLAADGPREERVNRR